MGEGSLPGFVYLSCSTQHGGLCVDKSHKTFFFFRFLKTFLFAFFSWNTKTTGGLLRKSGFGVQHIRKQTSWQKFKENENLLIRA